MNVLILEDEAPAARRLIRQLHDLDDTLTITEVIPSVAKAISWLTKQSAPALIFSDIRLTDGLSFEVFRRVDLTCPIIFTTAYDEYALKAFKLNSIDYLLKPIDPQELQGALAKFRLNHSSLPTATEPSAPDLSIELTRLFGQLASHQPTYRYRFLVTHRDAYFPVSARDIAYFYSENKVTRLVQFDGRWFPFSETLEELADQLDPKQFFRASRQYIVNLDAVKAVHKHFNGKVKVILAPPPAEDVMISRLKADEFKQWLMQR